MRHTLAVLALLVAPVALASGARGLVLTADSVDGFREATLDEVVGFHYLGSTEAFHLFLRVERLSGGGMPSDNLVQRKVPVNPEVPISNGWSVAFADKYVEAQDCPTLMATSGSYAVSADVELRARCGTEAPPAAPPPPPPVEAPPAEAPPAEAPHRRRAKDHKNGA